MQFFFIESSPYDELEDDDHFENSANPYPYIICYGGGTEPLRRHSAFSDYDAAVDRANELAQFISDKVEVVYDGTDDIETIYIATPLHESSPYDNLEDNDQFSDESQEWDLAHKLEFDGYGPVILLYQSFLRPRTYDICIDLNQESIDWDDIPDDMVKDFAVMLGVKNLNQPDLRKETLQVIWNYMLEHKKAWRLPISDSPHLIGLI